MTCFHRFLSYFTARYYNIISQNEEPPREKSPTGYQTIQSTNNGGMITVPVSAQMYQTMIANIHQLQPNGDGTVCLTPMQVHNPNTSSTCSSSSSSASASHNQTTITTTTTNSHSVPLSQQSMNFQNKRLVHTIVARNLGGVAVHQRGGGVNNNNNAMCQSKNVAYSGANENKMTSTGSMILRVHQILDPDEIKKDSEEGGSFQIKDEVLEVGELAAH
jgi:Nrf1 activator activation site binding domain